MNAMKNKIKSQKGASITFALLLFLVCAVVSIVVVVAGSAATGRMSERAETDQRYYAVSSAIELLCNDFNEKTATVEYTKKTSVNSVSGSDISVSSIVAAGSVVNDILKYPIVEEASKHLVDMIANDVISDDGPEFELSTDLSDDKAALGCAISEKLYKDGRLEFVVANKTVASTDPCYVLQVTFIATINKSVSQYKDGSETMEFVTTTVEWKIGGIKKG